LVSGIIKDAFSLWLNRHVETAHNLVQLFIDNAQQRQRESQKVTRKKVTSGPALPGKLADCTTDEPEQCELFLVEGDSAGGSAKQARDREFQAVMPLKGKILNTWEVDPHRVLASQEIHDIAVALGVDPGTTILSGLRYNKVCVLADADSDGQHIAALLCALFVRHFPALVGAGHVYIAMPPLYRIELGQQVYYALDEAEKTTIIHKLQDANKRNHFNVVRFKGLGEMNPGQLRETTMAPQSRRLTQLTLEDSAATQQVMDMLLSKRRAKDRRQWLHEKGDLADVLA
jgi:topoisomerase-4 subunit B